MRYLEPDRRHRVGLCVNGNSAEGDAEPRTLLSDFLRHELGLTGTHVGCEHGVCGACTVLLDGRPARSCLLFAVQVHGRAVTTVEGLAAGGELTGLQRALARHHAVQCGFCTPGILMSLTCLLEQEPGAREERVREALSGHICRCTGYEALVRATLDALGETG
ncbi:MAG: (2Fe-2S)-binding protein [Alphaproteobacteria bacterium]|nr:(2Fe-2S)-binding protein [Alphaproteobacteria bacterium]